MLELLIILTITIALFIWGKFPPDVVALISMSQLIDTKIGAWEFQKNYDLSIMRLHRRHPNVLKRTAEYVDLPKPDGTNLWAGPIRENTKAISIPKKATTKTVKKIHKHGQ